MSIQLLDKFPVYFPADFIISPIRVGHWGRISLSQSLGTGEIRPHVMVNPKSWTNQQEG